MTGCWTVITVGNGRLFPFGWFKINRLISEIDVVTFKLIGVLEEFRRRGIYAFLHMVFFLEKTPQILAGSLTTSFRWPPAGIAARKLRRRYIVLGHEN